MQPIPEHCVRFIPKVCAGPGNECRQINPKHSEPPAQKYVHDQINDPCKKKQVLSISKQSQCILICIAGMQHIDGIKINAQNQRNIKRQRVFLSKYEGH